MAGQALHSASGSSAEDLFIELFSETFGAEKAGYLYTQYHFYDIYQNDRFADFYIENGSQKIAVEIDDEASHNPRLVSQNKFYDDLLKQNSMIHLGWDVYRWAVRQMQIQPDTVKDELRVFLGNTPMFREVADYLPSQKGKAIDGKGKESLLVFDFVDNASQYNMPYSMHRLFKLSEYKPGKLVLGTKQQKAADDKLYARGEKPDAIIDFPVSATDYEAVDVFNWQEEAAGMISQMEFIRRVDAASETVERYIREGEIIPDLIVPISEHRTFKYFTEETLEKTAEKFGWQLINDENRKELFMEMIRQMDMSYSYKPVLIKAILANADAKGRIKLDDIVAYFKNYYEGRRNSGLVVEKPNSIFAKGGYTDKDAQRNILSNPFKRFEDMQMLRHTKTLGIVEVEPTVWKNLSDGDKEDILRICEEKLESYYRRFAGK